YREFPLSQKIHRPKERPNTGKLLLRTALSVDGSRGWLRLLGPCTLRVHGVEL
ncbi:hypothetical protein NDU88_004544, partial [Pleurodeles waltl]